MSTPGALLYRTATRHVRRTPVSNAFTYRGYAWLVDLDELTPAGAPAGIPDWAAPLARFRARDHLGDPRRTWRENVETFLARHGIDLQGGRVLALCHGRVLGYVFNPITVYWCHGPAQDGDRGPLRAVIAEVHNTYGERHAYLLDPCAADPSKVLRTEKAFYVSPFNPVDGHYEMRLPVPDDRLSLAVTLHRPQAAPFVATWTGRVRPAGPAGLLRAAARAPLAPLVVRALIVWQGVRLWARRLPVQPRPPAPDQPGVTAPAS